MIDLLFSIKKPITRKIENNNLYQSGKCEQLSKLIYQKLISVGERREEGVSSLVINMEQLG